MFEQVDVISITADIVAAFVSNNSVRAAELPDLIASVHASLIRTSAPEAEPSLPELKPAVPIKKSVTDDYIISLEDGRKFKSLRRHLQTAFGMTPDDYRAKWGLPNDYPMVAPGYSVKRSELAKSAGLGNFRKAAAGSEPKRGEPSADQAREAAELKPAATAPTPSPEIAVEPPVKRRVGRPKKAR